MAAAAVDDVERATYGDVDHELRLLVEVAGAVDRAQMRDAVDALAGAGGDIRVADIAGHHLDTVGDIDEPARVTAPMVVEHADACAVAHQPPHQRRAEKSAAPRHEIAARAHRCAGLPSVAP